VLTYILEVADDTKIKGFHQQLTTWKTTVEHHLAGLEKYQSKMAQFLD